MMIRKIAVHVFISCCLFFQTLSIAQISPTVSPMLLYSCKGSSIVLDLGICPITGSTFSWSAGATVISTKLNPTVNPIKTTSYLFTCTHPTGGVVIKILKVIVVEDFKLDGDISDRLEGSKLPFKGEVVGDIPADLAIKYVFTWTTPSATGSKEVINNLKMANVDITAPIIPLTSTSHKELMTVSLQ